MVIGSWALARDYCWDSLVSLYTFQETYALPDLARDCSYEFSQEFSPNSPNFQPRLLGDAPKSLGMRSTTELPRHINYSPYNTKNNVKNQIAPKGAICMVISSFKGLSNLKRDCHV